MSVTITGRSHSRRDNRHKSTSTTTTTPADAATTTTTGDAIDAEISANRSPRRNHSSHRGNQFLSIKIVTIVREYAIKGDDHNHISNNGACDSDRDCDSDKVRAAIVAPYRRGPWRGPPFMRTQTFPQIGNSFFLRFRA